MLGADVQKSYKEFLKETKSIEEKSTAIVHNFEEKTESEIDLSRSNRDEEAVMLEFDQFSNGNAELWFGHEEFRGQAERMRRGERALKQAKAILSGADWNRQLGKQHCRCVRKNCRCVRRNCR